MKKSAKLDFKAIASAALNRAHILVAQWLPGGDVSGGEYKALNPTRGDRSKGSFSINLRSGVWSDFAAGESGGDLISLYAYINGLSQIDAAKEVAAQMGISIDDAEPKTGPRSNVIPIKQPDAVPEQEATSKRTLWRPILPAPDDAGQYPLAHPVRGRPQATYEYFNAQGNLLGIICRFTTSDGGKEVLPCCFAEHTQNKKREWRWMAFPEPRPLYGLYELAQYPDLPVLIVEGEKCADAGHKLLKGQFVVITWPGGAKAIGKIDWSPLRGRVIYVWADSDAQYDKTGNHLLPESQQPGMSAMLKICSILGNPDNFHIVDIPQPGDKPDGWDTADAIQDGMGAEELTKFILHTRPVEQAPVRQSQYSSSGGDDGGPPWSPRDLVWDGKKPASCLSNVYDILEHDKQWQGVLGYDEFAYRTMKLKAPPFVGGKEGEWTGDDDVQTAMWITRKYGFAPSESLTGLAVETLAKFHGYNPVQDYLRSLKWDGVERLNDWIADFLGARKTEYVWRVSRWFLVGMVARAMKPGIKFDYCLVLEGEQGRQKSSALRVLGGEWFGDTDLDLHNKDSMSALRGKWLYEIAELGSLARSEATRQKSFFSRQVDEYRPAYGKREIRCPRQLVFGGTTNEWEWNKDPTGGRRFWPVECEGDVDVNGLSATRDQLFAEAYQVYLSGERFWPDGHEQRQIFNPEQFKLGTSDSYVDMIESWVAKQYREKEFCIADVAVECLKIDAARLSRDIQTRIGSALRQLGCRRIEKRTHATTRFWYKSPTEMGHGRQPGRSDEERGGHGIDF
ncbi:VapE domain-containing protein [Nitrosomonas communis]|nr:VapE domain-containing protein [Nitrosomonas communis]